MDITDEDEGPVGDYGVDEDYGAWHYLDLLKQPMIRRTVNEVKVDYEKLNAVLKFCYLGGMLCF